jgi:uncharacterized membrane protein
MKRPAREIRPLVLVISGFLLWSAAFLAIYGAQATGCSFGWDTRMLLGPVSIQRALLLVLFALVLVGHAVLVMRLNGWTRPLDSADAETADFMRTTARRLALIAAGASVICFGGVVWLAGC